jgi:hypothetical protein
MMKKRFIKKEASLLNVISAIKEIPFSHPKKAEPCGYFFALLFGKKFP